jgi:hypothetical protein
MSAVPHRIQQSAHFRSGTSPALRGLVVGRRALAYGVNEPRSCSFMPAIASSSPRASLKVTKPNPRGAPVSRSVHTFEVNNQFSRPVHTF